MRRIVKGDTSINQAVMMGESLPVDKTGTLTYGRLEVREVASVRALYLQPLMFKNVASLKTLLQHLFPRRLSLLIINKGILFLM